MADKRDLAVLILSCDKYADMWQPFLRQFRHFFPAKDHKIYVGSNVIPCDVPGVHPVLSGRDVDWSSSYRKILAQIEQPKLFVILEDIFLTAPVDMEGFHSALSFLFQNDAHHIKYTANPPPDLSTENPRIGVYLRGAPYRATVCGFWDRKYLTGLLIDGENPWNFEILGSYRTSYSDGFYGLTRPLFAFQNMVEKGCWIPKALEWARRENIDLNLDKRPVFKGVNKFLSLSKIVYFNSMARIPWRWRVAAMNKFRRALISY